jgi:hypothetical protein
VCRGALSEFDAVRGDNTAWSNGDRPSDNVLKLSNVARPIVRQDKSSASQRIDTGRSDRPKNRCARSGIFSRRSRGDETKTDLNRAIASEALDRAFFEGARGPVWRLRRRRGARFGSVHQRSRHQRRTLWMRPSFPTASVSPPAPGRRRMTLLCKTPRRDTPAAAVSAPESLTLSRLRKNSRPSG